MFKKILSSDLKKRFQEVWKRQQDEIRANHVVLSRKYRIGELPDVQIPHSDILLPLQALHVDPVISKEVKNIFIFLST